MDLNERSINPHRHPWELSRADMILQLLSTNPTETSYVDIGSGDLYFAQRLSAITDAPVFAVDVNYESPGSAGRVVVCTDLDQVPAASIDCAVLMDVLEHVDDDVGLLRGLDRVLKPTSQVLVTVPAHRSLWSDHDVFLGHRRRYERQQLLRLLEGAGLAVAECFYFYSVPYLVRAIDVALRGDIGRRNYQSGLSLWSFPTDHVLTKIVWGALNYDFKLSRRLSARQWSRGLSLCAVCQRRSV